MRSPRKIVRALLVAAAIALLVLVAVPLLLRDRIAARLRAEVDRSVNARVAWGAVDLSAFADFPNLSLGVDRVSVVGVKPFAGDTLVAARRVRLVLDLASVVRYLRSGDRIVVREIELRQPTVHLLALADGTANWDIARASDRKSAGPSRALALTLRQLRVIGGTVTVDDRHAGVLASVAGLDQTLRGDFGKDLFTIAARTRADSVSFRFGGVPYLSRVAFELNADVAADLRAHRFTFRNDSLRLNGLVLAFSGSATMADPNVALDLAFSAPSTAFRDIFSLVPTTYARDVARLQTSGRMSVAGRVRGTYGPHAFPALAIRARVENGAFRDPRLPLPARDIFMDLAVDNPGGDVDSTVVDLKRFHAVIGRQPLDAVFVMRNPVSDPDVDLRLRGTLDLADVGRTIALSGLDQLSGVVAADVAMRARLSQLDAGRYDAVAARGTLNVARLALKSAAVPRAMTLDTAALSLTPRRAELTTFAGRVGNSDVRGSGSLENLLGFALRGDVLRGHATVSSSRFDLDEWRSTDETTEVIPVPANVDFSLDATAARVTYGALTAANVHGALRVKDRKVTLDGLRMDMLGGAVVANGYYETTVASRPTFDLGLRVTTVDVPSAFGALVTVQKLAPVARWAQGSVSGDVALKGALGHDMLPLFDALTGHGSVESGRLVLQGVPVMTKLAESLALEQLKNPALDALRASFDITNGRLVVKPFDVRIGRTTMTVAGSNGIDQSLDYALAVAVPHDDLGAAGGGVAARLASQAGKAGIDLSAAEIVQLGARVTGTILNPSIKPNFSGVASSAREAAHYAARAVVESHVADAKQRVDSAADAARARARAEADKLVRDAEQQAATIREQARALAATGRQEAATRADSLVARASNPGARLAARVAADRVRAQADQQADRAVREADARADALVSQARKQADALAPPAP